MDDIPLAKRAKLISNGDSKPKAEKKSPIDEESDDDVPLSVLQAQLKRKNAESKPAATSKSLVKAKSENNVNLKAEIKKEKKVDSKSDIAKSKIVPSKPTETEKKIKVKKQTDVPVKSEKDESKKSSQLDDEESEEYHRWWEEMNGDDSIKWTTLEHNGVFFPPEYVPHGIKMKYDGKELDLTPEAEEVAGFFAALIGTEHAENEIFRKNFFEDFKKVLVGTPYEKLITDMSKCDFSPMTTYFAALKEAKKNRSKEEKEKEKAEKQKIEMKYGFCLLDGRKEKVGNFRIEPPGLFRGRGKHPKAGKLKQRVYPEQVTINIGADSKVPQPPPGHTWKEVINNPTVTWLATWTENVNNNIKYVFLAAGSSLKGQSDFKKFEKARELKKYVDEIRRKNAEELRDKEMMVRQRATALWLIDHLALRAGNEKGEDEADTVGCCSLRCEHVTLVAPKTVIFDFLGKDSIRYYNEVEVDEVIFKNLKIFMREPKTKDDLIFDRLTTTTLNKFLNSLMPGLSAKVFRTFNASHTFQKELVKTPSDAAVPEKLLAYNRANREVAVLCNHQRSIPKSHGSSMEKMKDKLLTLKCLKREARLQLKDLLDLKELKKRPELNEEESDLDEEIIEKKRQEQIEKENEKNEKMKEKNPSFSPKKKTAPSAEKLEKQLQSLNQKLQAAKIQMTDRDENKTTALGTSKTNYIDPRISSSWCKKYDVPIEKIFNRSLREKFKWAMEVDKDWEF